MGKIIFRNVGGHWFFTCSAGEIELVEREPKNFYFLEPMFVPEWNRHCSCLRLGLYNGGHQIVLVYGADLVKELMGEESKPFVVTFHCSSWHYMELRV